MVPEKRMLRTLRTVLATFATACLAVACGQSKSVQGVSAGSGTAVGGASGGALNGATACTSKTNCPAAAADVSANFQPSGALLGFIGEPVDWEFHGLDRNTVNADQQTSGRTVTVLLDKVPEGSTISPGTDSGKVVSDVKLNWTPTQAQSGQLTIILRDMDRCMKDEAADFCNAYTLHEKYDTKMAAVAWQVVDKSQLQAQIDQQAGGGGAGGTEAATGGGGGNVINVANVNCGTTPSTNGQIMTNGVMSGVKILTNPVGGLLGMLTSPSILGSLTGSSSSSTDKPKQCT
jgi:hypothetical protein